MRVSRSPRAPRVKEPVLLGMASRVPAVGRGVAFNSKLTSPGVPAATPTVPPPNCHWSFLSCWGRAGGAGPHITVTVGLSRVGRHGCQARCE